jgi:hypothetical protein
MGPTGDIVLLLLFVLLVSFYDRLGKMLGLDIRRARDFFIITSGALLVAALWSIAQGDAEAVKPLVLGGLAGMSVLQDRFFFGRIRDNVLDLSGGPAVSWIAGIVGVLVGLVALYLDGWPFALWMGCGLCLSGSVAGAIDAWRWEQRHGRLSLKLYSWRGGLTDRKAQAAAAPPAPVGQPRRLPDGTVCAHEGETSNYCTRCWAPLKQGVGA